MTALRRIAVFMALWLPLLLVAPGAQAGRACESREVDGDSLRKALQLALKTRHTLDDTGAQVAMVARVGRDLSKYGLRYSHFGIVWRDHPDGPWTVVHKLNDCGMAQGWLYAEGLGNFFADDMFAWESWIVVPREAVQQGLVRLLSRDQGQAFHRPAYSLVAYPFSTRYQNSNQWGLEVLAGAMGAEAGITDRESAQAWLRAAGYQPTSLKLGPLTRLGGRMLKANIAFDDHPPDLRWSNRIDTVTVESVYAFMLARDAVQRSIQIKL